MILLEHINTITHDLIIGWLNAEYAHYCFAVSHCSQGQKSWYRNQML